MATAAKYVIAEVEEIVECGELDPDYIHTPGVFVDAIVLTTETEWPIEHLRNDDGDDLSSNAGAKVGNRFKIAKKIAQELKGNSIVNLGLGIPTLVPSFVE